MKLRRMFVFCSLLTVFMVVLWADVQDVYSSPHLPVNMRIGLTTDFNQVSSASLPARALEFGFERDDVFVAEAMVEASGAFVVVPTSRYYSLLAQGFGTFAEARAAMEHFSGRVTVAFLAPGNWAVYGGGFSGAQEAQATGGAVLAPAYHRTALLDGDRVVVVFDSPYINPQFRDAGLARVSLGNRTYHGVVEFGRFGGRGITAINVLPVDSYVSSVVAFEMSPSWPLDALKAQAVAARTYAAHRMMTFHPNSPFHLCDGHHCQRYLGIIDNERELTMHAALSTSGVLIFYNDEPILATYFSSSGGATENSENVWVEALPYLRSVPDFAEHSHREWTRSFSLDDLNSLLNANSVNIGRATGVSVQLSPNGRVLGLTIMGSGGSHTLRGERVRTFFSSSPRGSLYSKNFVIPGSSSTQPGADVTVLSRHGTSVLNPGDATGITAYSIMSAPVSNFFVQDTSSVFQVETGGITTITSSAANIVITGRGWGHGVGMSQYGARGMAEAGFSYREILQHYFTGVIIR